MKIAVLLIGLALWEFQGSAQVNSWTNPVSGRWDSGSWSLGILPNSNQTVVLTNDGYKAVGVDSLTIGSFPASLTISNLQISAPSTGLSTLLLNHAGTSVPLRVTETCEILERGTLMNLHSALVMEGAGASLIKGGALIQEGGTLVATNAFLQTDGATISLTNAHAEFGTLLLGVSPYGPASILYQANGVVRGNVSVDNATYNLLGGLFTGNLIIGKYANGFFYHFEGTNKPTTLEIGISPFGSGFYTMYGGYLHSSEIRVGNAPVGRGWFTQMGGNIETGLLKVGGSGDFYQSSIGNFFLTNGSLRTTTLQLVDGRLVQSGGHHITASHVSLQGVYHEDRYGIVSMTPAYILHGGTFISPGISLNAWSEFHQLGGTNAVQGNLEISNTSYRLENAWLSTSNTIIAGPDFKETAAFVQSGGTHKVNGTLSVLGHYYLSNGTLACSNIVLSGRLVVTNAVLENTGGLFSIAGELQLRGSSQSLGQVQLLDNSWIDFASEPVDLHFETSIGRTWNAGKLLVVTNWDGQLSGKGRIRLRFGTSREALTSMQVAQLQFINPVGLAPGRYAAQLLVDGEVVPDSAAVPLSIAIASGQQQITLDWPGGLILQYSTNIAGPYSDLSDSSSPYTWTFSSVPQQFFRLRR